MIRYLQGGWYSGKNRPRLKRQVIDGAMDVAGMLHRAGLPAHRLLRVALKVRSLVVLANPLIHRTGRVSVGERESMRQRFGIYTDGHPELQSFLNDCLDHVSDANDLTALYLHLIHIARMMQLLSYATGNVPRANKKPVKLRSPKARSRR